MSKVQYKVQKLKIDGVIKFVPMRKQTFMGFGAWKVDPDWEAAEARLASEKALGLTDDSTLMCVRKFIDQRTETAVSNKFYEDGE